MYARGRARGARGWRRRARRARPRPTARRRRRARRRPRPSRSSRRGAPRAWAATLELEGALKQARRRAQQRGAVARMQNARVMQLARRARSSTTSRASSSRAALRALERLANGGPRRGGRRQRDPAAAGRPLSEQNRFVKKAGGVRPARGRGTRRTSRRPRARGPGLVVVVEFDPTSRRRPWAIGTSRSRRARRRRTPAALRRPPASRRERRRARAAMRPPPPRASVMAPTPSAAAAAASRAAPASYERPRRSRCVGRLGTTGTKVISGGAELKRGSRALKRARARSLLRRHLQAPRSWRRRRARARRVLAPLIVHPDAKRSAVCCCLAQIAEAQRGPREASSRRRSSRILNCPGPDAFVRKNAATCIARAPSTRPSSPRSSSTPAARPRSRTTPRARATPSSRASWRWATSRPSPRRPRARSSCRRAWRR